MATAPHSQPLILFCGWLEKANKSHLVGMFARRYLVLTPTALHWFEAPLGSTPSSYSSETAPVLFGNHKGAVPIVDIRSLSFQDGVLTLVSEVKEGQTQTLQMKDAETKSRSSPSVADWYEALEHARAAIDPSAAETNRSRLMSGMSRSRARGSSVSGSYMPSVPPIAIVTSADDSVVVLAKPKYVPPQLNERPSTCGGGDMCGRAHAGGPHIQGGFGGSPPDSPRFSPLLPQMSRWNGRQQPTRAPETDATTSPSLALAWPAWRANNLLLGTRFARPAP
jgi:hypothetical protein